MEIPFELTPKNELHQALDFVSEIPRLQRLAMKVPERGDSPGAEADADASLETLSTEIIDISDRMDIWFAEVRNRRPWVFQSQSPGRDGVPTTPVIFFEDVGDTGIMIGLWMSRIFVHDIVWRITEASPGRVSEDLVWRVNMEALEAAEGCLSLIPYLTDRSQGIQGIKFCDGPLRMATMVYSRLQYQQSAQRCVAELQVLPTKLLRQLGRLDTSRERQQASRDAQQQL